MEEVFFIDLLCPLPVWGQRSKEETKRKRKGERKGEEEIREGFKGKGVIVHTVSSYVCSYCDLEQSS